MNANDESKYQKDRLIGVMTPNVRKVVDLLDLDVNDQYVVEVLSHLCKRVFYAGFDVGSSHVVAQVIQQAPELTLNVSPSLFDDTGPLSDA